MGLWHCPEHGLTGPEACCRSASYVTTEPVEFSTASQVAMEKTTFVVPLREGSCGVPGCYVCEGKIGIPESGS